MGPGNAYIYANSQMAWKIGSRPGDELGVISTEEQVAVVTPNLIGEWYLRGDKGWSLDGAISVGLSDAGCLDSLMKDSRVGSDSPQSPGAMSAHVVEVVMNDEEGLDLVRNLCR